MAVFKCKMCGGALDIYDESVMYCRFCGTKQTLPKMRTERIEALYDRAGQLRQNNEYDKATELYEQILTEDPDDAESYWSLVLCRYGIEYVYDPATDRRVPTVNRTQFTSIYDDVNYKEAIDHADPVQRLVYEQEAKAINDIQKDILTISQNEEPFDVFICYKETDQNGRRTPDSVLANDLYHQLTQEGFKVFFARITLEDKLGSAYEPYIFAALNSAKVMVVLGTKAEYIRSPWVENEWSRFLAMIRAGEKKMLIPAYKDMDPYDLPEEFSHLQAQDMSKLGFMQDLIRGIKKILGTEQKQASPEKEEDAAISPLLKRVFMFLEDGDFESADEYCERVLDMDPECPRAYIGKLMVEYHCHTRDELKNVKQDMSSNPHYKRVLRYGTPEDIAFIEECQRCYERAAAAQRMAQAAAKQQEQKARTEQGSSALPIEVLSLSVRTYNQLKRAQIHTVPELLAFTEEDLTIKAALNSSALEEIKSKLTSRGWHLRAASVKQAPQKPPVPRGTVIMEVDKSGAFDLLSYADGTAYKFVFDDNQEEIVISAKTLVSKSIHLPHGVHSVQVHIYSYNDPTCSGASTTCSQKQSFTVGERAVAITANRPNAFSSNCSVKITRR